MTEETARLNRILQQHFEQLASEDPRFAAMFARSPAYRYWTDDRGWRYCWTTERMGDGKFAAFIYRPVGRGARSGKATSFKLVRELHFAKRSTAKERARRWLNRACGRTAA